MKPTKSDVTLSISEVSDLVGVSAGILRTWEREGLIAPDRTSGGHRVFRNQHVRRLKRIAKLYFEDKLNPAAIRRILGPAGQPGVRDHVDAALGEKLRSIRLARKLTLNETSERSGLSPSFISALERGNTGVSLEALFRLAEALGTTIPSLRSAAEEVATQFHFVPGDGRLTYVSDDGRLTIQDIIPKPAKMEASITTIAPNAGSDGAYSHRGQEFVLVLEGELSFWLEPGEFFAMKAGDTLYFQSSLEHTWKNESDSPTRVLWVNAHVPPESEAGAGPILEPPLKVSDDG